MTNFEYKFIYGKYLDLFNNYSEKVFSTVKTETRLADAMKYSFFAGGKRIRPVLALALTDILGGTAEEILPFALALECVHTYSLIHDDLPALDGDVLRRGKPTCHVKFDESTAILAGDALLNFAFEHCLKTAKTEKDIKALLYLANCSGYNGMLGGQQLDIESEKKEGNETGSHSCAGCGNIPCRDCQDLRSARLPYFFQTRLRTDPEWKYRHGRGKWRGQRWAQHPGT